jgi:DNA-binding NtrC family response regulator
MSSTVEPFGSNVVGRVQPRSEPTKTMAEIEHQAILETPERTGGHRDEAAKTLEIVF